MPEQIVLNRDVEATVIPEGNRVTLPASTAVTITQQLGGTFTVVSQYGMSRINGKDADALGLEIPPEAQRKMTESDGPPNEDDLWEQMRAVYDPEIPVNIVDLGLVYSCETKKEEDNAYVVAVQMTLTAPGCGMGPVIAEDARQKILEVPGVSDATVDIVWDPPWNQDMITEEGKMILGLI